MTQLDTCDANSSRVLSWHQFTTMLSEDNGINCEEDWYEQTNSWVEETHESDTEDPFLLDDKSSFLKANELQETTLSELMNEDISSINIARLLSNDDIDELKIPLRQKYAMTQAVHHLNTSPTNANGLDEIKNRFNKQKTYSVIERISEKTNTKLSKSRSERITKVEKMNIWKRWKKPSGSNTNFNELHEGPVQEGDSG
ncbi:uncharacterized protein LOC134819801 isoform X2 [Bolinopsis microptera]|uniref:uncharacterized protein LOC134819801 isoform X2 n=1 Tax=Bolinopsis microptera TaxID=2820187 RepID=UPI00307A3B2C